MMTNGAKNYNDYLPFFIQYMKHRIQITQERLEYVLTTNSRENEVYATNDFTVVRRWQ